MKWLFIAVTMMALGPEPAPPDYRSADSWAALPDRADAADVVPEGSGLKDEQATAPVDVFYLHPTTYYRSYNGNADVTDKRLNKFTDENPIKKQASVYNGSARVFAPRYRQAALHSFFKRDTDKSRRAFQVAYGDVKRAFEYYMEHYNDGRGIIIAGHSQGSMHGKQLVREFFDGTEIQEQLVAAYLIGYSVKKGEFDFLSACESAEETGCLISFSSYGWEANPKYADYRDAICVNPVTWLADTKVSSRSDHLGGIPRTFDEVDREMVECKCTNNILWITKPKERGYIMMGGKNYHLVDYNLFYMDIRKNVAARTKAWLN